MAYTRDFYESMRSGSSRSASVVVPILLELVCVKSVVDVGCGDGTWLSVFEELGIKDTVGLDGNYVEAHVLRIPKDQFVATDLTSSFRLSRTFDLAISLEVAEHLPKEAAEGFVYSLTKLAPVVLFSAAIPFQDGIDHLNEQWPDYWASIFKRHDYLPIDCIRSRIWENNEVEWWYVQNTLLFVQAVRIHADAVLRREFERTNPRQLCLVHPRKYLHVARPSSCGVRRASVLLTQALKNSARKRIHGLACGNGDA